MTWIDTALSRLAKGERLVLATIVETRGSTPREIGARMLIGGGDSQGSIGGGRLEHKVTMQARQMLMTGPPLRVGRYNLGPELDQCCGGNVQVMFETLDAGAKAWLRRRAELDTSGAYWSIITAYDGKVVTKSFLSEDQGNDGAWPPAVRLQRRRRRPGFVRTGAGQDGDESLYFIESTARPASELYLYGAGHVGKAIVGLLKDLPFRVTWIDPRADEFPATMPENVTARISPTPQSLAAAAPADAMHLVVTHSHPLDLEICARILRRGEFRFLGLIGSETKRARFASRLKAIGIPANALARLVCPIGIPGIGGKEPPAIAIAVAAQLLIVDNDAARHAVAVNDRQAAEP
jgi:xanthine dehydrogenase accessory factor